MYSVTSSSMAMQSSILGQKARSFLDVGVV